MLPREFCPPVDKFLALDYSNVLLVSEALSGKNVKRVLSGANDTALLSAIKISKLLGCDGPALDEETWERVHDKLFLRRTLAKSSKAGVNYFEVSTNEWVSGEVPRAALLKPRLASGGRGIRKLTSRELLLTSDYGNYYSENYLVEEFIPGRLFSLFDGGAAAPGLKFFAREFAKNFAIVEARNPTKLRSETVAEISQQVENLRKETNLLFTPLHTQFIVDRTGAPRIIEVTARIPGDNYLNLIHQFFPSELKHLIASILGTAKSGTTKRPTLAKKYEHEFVSRYVLEGESNAIRFLLDSIKRFSPATNVQGVGRGKRLSGVKVRVFLLSFSSYKLGSLTSLLIRSLPQRNPMRSFLGLLGKKTRGKRSIVNSKVKRN